MIYFITNDIWHLQHYRNKLYDNIEVLEDTSNTLDIFYQWVIDKEEKIIGYDVESTGLDAWKNTTILRIIGDETDQFILHTPYCAVIPYSEILKEEHIKLLGHNIKFDIKFIKTEDNIEFTDVYDTMIAEQRLYMKSGLKFALDQLCIRYLDVYPETMDKTIRKEFIDVNPLKFKIKPKHLYYGAGDVSKLPFIKEKQEILIEKYNLNFLINKIEFPLIPIIAKAELKGFEFNTEKWLEVYNENLKAKFEIELKLDKEFKRLRNLLVPIEKLFFVRGGKWDNKRIHNPMYDTFKSDGTTNELDLFGNLMSKHLLTGTKKKIDKYPNNINYGSENQIIEIFGRFDQPVLTKQNTLVTPTFTKTHKVNKEHYSFQTGSDAFQEYLTLLPDTIMKDFINLLLKHRGLSTACNNFGINFIDKINPITGKLHTIFRQCRAETGRFQSGGGRLEKDKPNFQNIPSKAEYAIKLRNCFLAKDGYSIGTHDLSGAELIIMCSLSQDMKLLKIAKEDIHSYVAQGGWRRIYANRAIKLIKQHDALREINGKEYTDVTIVKEINKYINLSKTYIVNKSKKKIRTAFKPMTFGTIYGMYAAKAAKTLNIIKEEGQIIINFITNEFPNVFNMVLTASAHAKAQGFLILNSRTNSRAWFPNLIKLKRGEILEKTHFGIISKEESEARNIRIQGTQADMIKECSVELQIWINKNGYTDKITILSWIHDEIVDEHPNWMNGKSNEWKQWRTSVAYTPFSFISDTGKEITTDSFPELKRLLMIEVCNRYLNNVSMDCDYDVEPFWTK